MGQPPTTGAEEERAWHALPAAEAEEAFGVGSAGLAAGEAQERLRLHGPNELEPEEETSDWRHLANQFTSPLIYILLVAAVVTALIGEYIDTGVIAAVLVLNATIGFVQERRAERSVRALMQLAAPTAEVIRDGERQEVPSEEIVPGDVVVLDTGDRVPADLRLTRATSLEIDESLLTGESEPATKATDPVDRDAVPADRSSMAFMGTSVSGGRGRGVAVATGPGTQLGQIAEQVRGQEEPETPLQRRMRRFANVVAVAVLASAVAAVLVGIALGRPFGEMFLIAVALAVAVVPEGLPVVFTVAMALGVRRMAARRAIIRRLPAVETLGSTSTIGSDKTGTLTENRMTVQEVWTPAGSFALGTTRLGEDARELPEGGAPELDTGHPLGLTLRSGVLTNEARVTGRGRDGLETAGEPTEAALLVTAATAGLDPDELRGRHELVADMPFESARRYSASVRTADGRHRLWVKGAPERMLELCTGMADADGPTDLDPDAVLRAAKTMAERGLRVLAMAVRSVDRPPPDGQVPEPSQLTLVGLQGMLDPPREGVREAIEGCGRAGIRVVMITGDHADTARAIGRDLRLAEDDDEVVDGSQLERMSDGEVAGRVLEVPVFARVSPEHKLRITKAFQSHGHVTAVTGDGVNDAPALKAADIGIAMGESGTDVAKEASDMVLTDDNFVSIYNAVEEGRVTFDNVRKVTFFLVSTGAAAIVAIIASLLLGLPLPFLPAQLLWLNLVTNGMQDLALAFEPGEQGVLDRPPRQRHENIVSRLLWERTAVTGTVMGAGALALFAWASAGTASMEQARTIGLTGLVVFMGFHVFNARSEFTSVFRLNPLGNKLLLGAQALALAIHVGALYFPPTQLILRVEPIETVWWPRIVLLGVTVVAASEIHKLARRSADPRRHDVPRD